MTVGGPLPRSDRSRPISPARPTGHPMVFSDVSSGSSFGIHTSARSFPGRGWSTESSGHRFRSRASGRQVLRIAGLHAPARPRSVARPSSRASRRFLRWFHSCPSATQLKSGPSGRRNVVTPGLIPGPLPQCRGRCTGTPLPRRQPTDVVPGANLAPAGHGHREPEEVLLALGQKRCVLGLS